jgi:hypothetical protein
MPEEPGDSRVDQIQVVKKVPDPAISLFYADSYLPYHK